MKTIAIAVSAIVILLTSAVSAQPKQPELSKKDSWMTYRLTHPLHEIEATSKDVEYHLEIDAAKKEVRAVSAVVDVTTFNSGNSNRDSHAMEVIDAIDYPEVNFTSSSVVQAGDSLKIAGKLTFHGVTQDIVMMARPRWASDTLEVSGQFELSLTAFKIERPSLLMIPVQDALRFVFAAVFVIK